MEHRLFHYGDLHVFGERRTISGLCRKNNIKLDILPEDLETLKEEDYCRLYWLELL